MSNQNLAHSPKLGTQKLPIHLLLGVAHRWLIPLAVVLTEPNQSQSGGSPVMTGFVLSHEEEVSRVGAAANTAWLHLQKKHHLDMPRFQK